jgi:hypothetical protein
MEGRERGDSKKRERDRQREDETEHNKNNNNQRTITSIRKDCSVVDIALLTSFS